MVRNAFSRLARRWRWRRSIDAIDRELTDLSADLSSNSSGSAPILFFSAEGAVSPHLGVLSIVARALRDQGQAVYVSQCFNHLRRCSLYDCFGVPYEASKIRREQTCVDCAQRVKTVLQDLDLPSIYLGNLRSRELASTVREALRNLPRNLIDFEFEGLPFGRFCAMNLALRNKIYDFEAASSEIRGAWAQYIETSLTSYLMTRELLKRLTPRAIAHYGDYAVYLAVRLAAR